MSHAASRLTHRVYVSVCQTGVIKYKTNVCSQINTLNVCINTRLCQIQQAAERPERNFVDTRQLKVRT